MGGGRTKVVLFGLLWFLGAWVHQCPENPNATSRLDLLHAIVSHGSVQLDLYHHNTTDKAWWQGHYYSDKPPGVMLWALPSFFGLHLLLGDYLETQAGWFLSSWLINACSLGLLYALGGVSCFCWLSRWTSPRVAMITTLSMTMATPLLAYSSSWFPHAGVAGLLFIAFNLVDPARENQSDASSQALAPWTTAGLACGLAWSAEYSAALPLLSMGMLAWRRSMASVCVFALGWIPPLLLVGAYHWLCFGTPWTVPYSHTAILTHMREGLCGIHFPPATSHLTHLAVGLERGLLICSPFLLCLCLGWSELHRRNSTWFYLSYLTALLQWVLISGYADLSAGDTYGPRLLLCALPWLALPTALAFEVAPRLTGGLATVAFILTVAAVWNGIEIPPNTSLWEAIRLGPKAHHGGEFLHAPHSVSIAAWLIVLLAGTAWLCHRTHPSVPNRQ